MKPLRLIVLLALPFASVAQTAPLVLPLWPNGAPGFESRRNEPEQAKDYWVKNIHNPSIAVYAPPAEKSNGTAVLVCPGGGHRLLVYNAEGVEPARYLNSLGITAIVLKYRLAREEGSPYTLEREPRADAQRAMRMIRAHAAEWHIDSARVGMMGFSAGGELVDMLAFNRGDSDPGAPDPVDRHHARPDFLVQVYPGPLFIPDTIPHDAPPAFLVAANDDPCCAVSVVNLLNRYRAAGAPVSVFMPAHGDHGFNLGTRSKFTSVRTWSARLTDWLADAGLLPGGK